MAQLDPNIGRELGDFRIDAYIGRGGLGTVYRATQTTLNRPVAIKLLKPEVTDDEHLQRRFWREAKTLAKLDDQRIVRVLHFGKEEDTYFMAMEYVQGKTLHEIIQRDGKMEPRRAVRIARGIAEALAHAHAKNVIHRDIKPANVIVLDGGRVKVLDFGLAKIVGSRTTALTRQGMQLGTPLYMSPELWRGEPLTPQADIYALGAVLYEMLTAEPPFRGESYAAIMAKVLTQDLPNPTWKNPKVDERLAQIVRDMLARDPRKRYAEASALARDLAAYLADGGDPRGRAARAAQYDPEAEANQIATELLRRDPPPLPTDPLRLAYPDVTALDNLDPEFKTGAGDADRALTGNRRATTAYGYAARPLGERLAASLRDFVPDNSVWIYVIAGLAIGFLVFFVTPVRSYFEQGLQDVGLIAPPPLEH